MKRLFGGSPMLIFFLVLMAYNAISSGRFSNPGQWLMHTLLLLPGIVIGLTFHEFAHAYSAWRLGDQTPMAQNRVNLNPLSHIDIIGIVALLFVGFGWGRPVQVNPYAFRKNRRLSNLLVDVAGVTTNFIIAFICTGLLLIIPISSLYVVVVNIVYINIVLMVFNLLPIPPLDGFGILTEIFDLRRYSWHRTFYNYGFFILILLVFLGDNGIGKVLGPPLNAIAGFISHIWGVPL